MNYYDLIIITKRKIILNKTYDCFITNKDFKLIDEHHLIINNIEYEFNYLIYSYDINVTYNNLLLLDNDIPVTNFFYQTSLENIYYIHKENINEVINEILENN